MSYGLSIDPFLIKEGNLFIGNFSSIDFNDPVSGFSGENLGYFKQGSIKIGLTRKYAEFLSGTPAIRVRKDLIQKDFSLEVEFAQYNKDLIKLLFGADLVQSGGLENLYFGSDEPVQGFYGYLLETELTDGTPFKIAMWHGKCTEENISTTLPGNDYGILKMRVDAFPHPSITDKNKAYGFCQLDYSI